MAACPATSHFNLIKQQPCFRPHPGKQLKPYAKAHDMPHVLAWDIDLPDLRGYAAASGLEGKNRNQFAGRTLYRLSRDEFLSRRSKAPAPRAPQPPAGAFLVGHFRSRSSLGEQFCTDGYCQGVQARMTGDESALMSETDQFWEYR
jgi:hypothetical protein